jgi:hypothetical protein
MKENNLHMSTERRRENFDVKWNFERIDARISERRDVLRVRKEIGEDRFREIIEEQKAGPAYRTIAQGVSVSELENTQDGMEQRSTEEPDEREVGITEENRQLQPIRKFSDLEVSNLQNNIHKLYAVIKILENRKDFSMRDVNMLANFGRCYVFDPDNSYDDEDFTLLCNIEDCWIDGDGEAYLKTLSLEKRDMERKRFYEEDKELVLRSIKNISKRYFKLKFLMRLDVEGTVMYGRYLSQKILITRDEEYDIFYNIYLWYEDDSDNREELFAKTIADLRGFFRRNEVVVKWEEEKKE